MGLGGGIGRANIDGSSPNNDFIAARSQGLELAVDSSHIYWAENSSVGRANLDGSGADETFIQDAASVTGVAVDPSYVYWGEGSTGPAILRANLDGSGAASLVGAPASGYIAVDASHIYWIAASNDASNDTIGRANLDGSNPDPTFITGVSAPGGYIRGLAVDGSHIYWSNEVHARSAAPTSTAQP